MSAQLEVIRIRGWKIASPTPRVLAAQVTARYRDPTPEDGRFRHVDDPLYREKLLSLLSALRDQAAEVLVFPEYSWPAATASQLRATLPTVMPRDTVCVLPFEHLSLDEFKSALKELRVDDKYSTQVLAEAQARIAPSDRSKAAVNVAFVAFRGKDLTIIPQLKLRPAGMEEASGLGRWLFAGGRKRRVFRGSSFSFAVAICFDFIARERGGYEHLRGVLRDQALDLLIVPECNPSPFHSTYARGVIDLEESAAWAAAHTKIFFVNVARGTTRKDLRGIEAAFGFSRLFGDLGVSTPPVTGSFARVDGVIACKSPQSLKDIEAPKEHLRLPDLSFVVARPHESLLSVQLPTRRQSPTKDVTAGRVHTDVAVYRPIDPQKGEWSRIHAGIAAQRTAVAASGVPRDYLVAGGLIGQDAASSELEEAVRSQSAPVWVVGEGGTGKTALVANLLEERFVAPRTARVAWLDLAAVERDDDALRDELLSQLSRGSILVVEPKERWTSIEAELRKAPTVVVLDSYEISRSDLPLPSRLIRAARWPSRLVVTSRRTPPGDDQAFVVSIELLDQEAAARLLRREAGPELQSINIPDLVGLAEGSPLACTWIAHFVRDRPQEAAHLLAAIRSRAVSDLETLFGWLFDRLPQLDKEVLAVLADLRAPITPEQLGAILRRDPRELTHSGERLRRMNLAMLAKSDAGEELHTRHPFVRQFWTRFAESSQQTETFDKIVEWAAQLISECGGDRNWGRYDVLESQWTNLRFVLHSLVQARRDSQFLETWRGVDYFLWARGRFHERVAFGRIAEQVALRVGDDERLAHALFDSIAETLWHIDSNAPGVLELFGRAEDLYRRANKGTGLAMVAYYRSRLLRKRKLIDEARQQALEALSLARSAGTLEVQGFALNSLGNIDRDDGDYAGAIARYTEAATVFEQTKDAEMLAVVSRNRGRMELAAGNPGAAVKHLEGAIERFRELRLPAEEAEAAITHAEALARLGEVEEASDELGAAALMLDPTGSGLRAEEIADVRARIEEIKRQPK